jgi:hypothetical protein
MTQRQKVLKMLRDARPGSVTGDMFYASFIPRFSARINELRDKGFEIKTERLSRNRFRYRLLAEPGETMESSPDWRETEAPPGYRRFEQLRPEEDFENVILDEKFKIPDEEEVEVGSQIGFDEESNEAVSGSFGLLDSDFHGPVSNEDDADFFTGKS